jgi:hypothetical protein
VCPPNKRLVRLAVDQAEPFKIFELRNMLVAHAGQISNSTLLPVHYDALSSQPWGCVTIFGFHVVLQVILCITLFIFVAPSNLHGV